MSTVDRIKFDDMHEKRQIEEINTDFPETYIKKELEERRIQIMHEIERTQAKLAMKLKHLSWINNVILVLAENK